MRQVREVLTAMLARVASKVSFLNTRTLLYLNPLRTTTCASILGTHQPWMESLFSFLYVICSLCSSGQEWGTCLLLNHLRGTIGDSLPDTAILFTAIPAMQNSAENHFIFAHEVFAAFTLTKSLAK